MATPPLSPTQFDGAIQWQLPGSNPMPSGLTNAEDIPWPPATSDHDESAYNGMTWEDKQRVPWQYFGVPALSRHMASSHDYLVSRRFSPTQVRCLLYLQNQIGMLEEQLKAWDDYAMKLPTGSGNSGSMSDDPFPERSQIIEKLLPLLQRYNDLARSFSDIRSRPTASRHQIRNLKNWFVTYPDAIAPDEQFFRDNEGDLFSLNTRRKIPLSLFLSQFSIFQHLFRIRKRTDHEDPKISRHWSQTAIETFSTFVIIFGGLGILVGPIWWLNYIDKHIYQLAIISGFSTLFLLCAYAAAGNRPFELLAAVAAYTAVLMIYRQLGVG